MTKGLKLDSHIYKSPPRVLAIIPAYNEQESIVKVAESTQNSYHNVDILVVNDQSTDNTSKLLRKHQINHVSLPTNLGIGGAVQTGFIFAAENDYDFAVQVDGDGQHPPEQLPELIKHLILDNADFVIGSRYLASNQIVSTWTRRLGSGFLATLTFIATGKKITDPTSGFRAYNKKAIQFLSKYYPQEYPEPISVIELLDHGYRLKEIPVKMKRREHGISSITGFNTLFYMIKVMFAILIVKLRRGKV